MQKTAFVVRDLEQAKAALKAARERGLFVSLISEPGAAAQLGPAVWRAMIAEADRAEPGALKDSVLDCGADPGWALAALREGLKTIAVSLPADARAKIADIAAQLGAKVLDGRPAAKEWSGGF
ncbi:MAG: hypothetical protein FJX42_10490 [Alphaproteobacteria bacterium]|nr:hypothetical protein [Alphaproteobacteria bacterium]